MPEEGTQPNTQTDREPSPSVLANRVRDGLDELKAQAGLPGSEPTDEERAKTRQARRLGGGYNRQTRARMSETLDAQTIENPYQPQSGKTPSKNARQIGDGSRIGLASVRTTLNARKEGKLTPAERQAKEQHMREQFARGRLLMRKAEARANKTAENGESTSKKNSAVSSAKNGYNSLRRNIAEARLAVAKAKEALNVKRAIERKTKALIQRGVIYLINFIAGAIDAATGGGGLLVTILVKAVTLGLLNVQMVYGSWIAGGKSKLIEPLTWEPIPFPFADSKNPSPIILHLGLIVVDLAVLILTAVILGFFIILLLFMIDPLGTSKYIGEFGSFFGTM